MFSSGIYQRDLDLVSADDQWISILDTTLPCCACPLRLSWTLRSCWDLCLPPARFCPTTISATSPDGDVLPVSWCQDPFGHFLYTLINIVCLIFVFFLFLYLCLAGGSLSPQLKQAYLPVVDHQTCTSPGWWGSTVKTTMVCAGGAAEAGCNVSLSLHWNVEVTHWGVKITWQIWNLCFLSFSSNLTLISFRICILMKKHS